jgi:hypothetical protein
VPAWATVCGQLGVGFCVLHNGEKVYGSIGLRRPPCGNQARQAGTHHDHVGHRDRSLAS